MCEDALLRRTGSPILATHHAVVGCGTAESDSVALVVRAHPGERTAPGYQSLEVKNMRRLQIRSRGLIVAAVFVQPRNRIRIGAAVRSQGVSLAPNVGKLNAAPVKTLPFTKLLRSKTEDDSDRNESIFDLLTL
jgi:hypothetical protein